MARKRHGAEHIVAILRQIEVELANHKSTGQACNEAGITEQTYYRWRKGVRRVKAGTGEAAERAGEGKQPSTTPGGRAVSGEASLKGCGGGKLLSERRRCAVEHARDQHRLSVSWFSRKWRTRVLR